MPLPRALFLSKYAATAADALLSAQQKKSQRSARSKGHDQNLRPLLGPLFLTVQLLAGNWCPVHRNTGWFKVVVKGAEGVEGMEDAEGTGDAEDAGAARRPRLRPPWALEIALRICCFLLFGAERLLGSEARLRLRCGGSDMA